eukprot:GHVU01182850.1.p1 GENE.GHVU01182850.1~~GHVU01182850.1.p1  ORF type:complete len:1009 (-),score=227.41 GHVU01182850.1:26-3052(-)
MDGSQGHARGLQPTAPCLPVMLRWHCHRVHTLLLLLLLLLLLVSSCCVSIGPLMAQLRNEWCSSKTRGDISTCSYFARYHSAIRDAAVAAVDHTVAAFLRDAAHCSGGIFDDAVGGPPLPPPEYVSGSDDRSVQLHVETGRRYAEARRRTRLLPHQSPTRAPSPVTTGNDRAMSAPEQQQQKPLLQRAEAEDADNYTLGLTLPEETVEELRRRKLAVRVLMLDSRWHSHPATTGLSMGGGVYVKIISLPPAPTRTAVWSVSRDTDDRTTSGTVTTTYASESGTFIDGHSPAAATTQYSIQTIEPPATTAKPKALKARLRFPVPSRAAALPHTVVMQESLQRQTGTGGSAAALDFEWADSDCGDATDCRNGHRVVSCDAALVDSVVCARYQGTLLRDCSRWELMRVPMHTEWQQQREAAGGGGGGGNNSSAIVATLNFTTKDMGVIAIAVASDGVRQISSSHAAAMAAAGRRGCKEEGNDEEVVADSPTLRGVASRGAAPTHNPVAFCCDLYERGIPLLAPETGPTTQWGRICAASCRRGGETAVEPKEKEEKEEAAASASSSSASSATIPSVEVSCYEDAARLAAAYLVRWAPVGGTGSGDGRGGRPPPGADAKEVGGPSGFPQLEDGMRGGNDDNPSVASITSMKSTTERDSESESGTDATDGVGSDCGGEENAGASLNPPPAPTAGTGAGGGFPAIAAAPADEAKPEDDGALPPPSSPSSQRGCPPANAKHEGGARSETNESDDEQTSSSAPPLVLLLEPIEGGGSTHPRRAGPAGRNSIDPASSDEALDCARDDEGDDGKAERRLRAALYDGESVRVKSVERCDDGSVCGSQADLPRLRVCEEDEDEEDYMLRHVTALLCLPHPSEATEDGDRESRGDKEGSRKTKPIRSGERRAVAGGGTEGEVRAAGREDSGDDEEGAGKGDSEEGGGKDGDGKGSDHARSGSALIDRDAAPAEEAKSRRSSTSSENEASAGATAAAQWWCEHPAAAVVQHMLLLTRPLMRSL